MRRQPTSPTARLLTASVVGVVALAALLGGCGPDGEARFEATLTAGGCYQEQFPFEPDFFALVNTDTGILIRMEEHVRERTRTDGLYLIIDPARTGKPGLDGQPLTCPTKDDVKAGGTFKVEPEGCLLAYFRFNYSCPRDYLNIQFRGDITFEAFGVEEGQEVRGSLAGELVELRTSPGYEGKRIEVAPAGQVSGTFAFEVGESPNRQIYQWPPVHIDVP